MIKLILPLRSLAAACLGFALSFAAQGLSQSGQSQLDIAPSVVRLLSIEGEALNPKSGAVVYREFHFCDKQSISCQVKYEDSNGTPIIEKELDFSSNAIAPDFEQLDLRTGRFIASEQQGDYTLFSVSQSRLVETYVEGQIVKPDDAKNRTLLTPSQLVIDAGFDNFIRQQWDGLVTGDKTEFEFALPSRGTAIPMQIKPSSDVQCQRLTAGQNARCFQLQPKSALFRVFLKPIQLAYDKESRKLLAFKGLSSIKDSSDNAQVVLIRYRYP